MTMPEEIVYERWWSVYPSNGGLPTENFPTAEDAVRRAVELSRGGALFVNVSLTDRPKQS